MHRFAYIFGCFLCLLGTLLCSCASDTHYDSMVATVTIDNLPESPYDNASVSFLHRITFDRDVASLKSIALDNAWLSIDVGESSEDRLQMVKAASVSVLENSDSAGQPWLTTIANLRGKNEAQFLELKLDSLADYIHDGQLIIRIDYELDPFLTLRYREDYCVDKEVCSLDLLLSMTFEMVD